MSSEIRILKKIQNDNISTQRELAKTTGISLGNVNVLLRRLISKGLINVEKINSRTIKYILTPKGIREKSEATYRYIIDCYKYINEISMKIDKILQYELNNNNDIILLGKIDIIYELLFAKMSNNKIRFYQINSVEEIKKLSLNKDSLILIWNPEYIDIIGSIEIRYINILDKM